MHNTKESKRYNKDRSHKKAGGMPKPKKPASGKDEMNFAQLICTKTKTAVSSALKKANHGMKFIIAMKRVIVILTPTTEVFSWIAQVTYML